MCQGQVDWREFERQWKIRPSDYFAEELPALSGFVSDGLLESNADSLRVKGEGFLFLRNIAMTFDRYLEGIRQQAKTPTFSKTV